MYEEPGPRRRQLPIWEQKIPEDSGGWVTPTPEDLPKEEEDE